MSVRGWAAAAGVAGVLMAGCTSQDADRNPGAVTTTGAEPPPIVQTTTPTSTSIVVSTSPPLSDSSSASQPAAASESTQATTPAQQAALEYTQVVLPRGAVVLASQHQVGLATLYGLVIRVDKAAVDELLKRSGFTKPLEKGRAVTLPVTGGIAPGTGDQIESGQDVLTQALIREVLVDRTNPDEVRVHVWAHKS